MNTASDSQGEKLTHVLPHYIKEESIGFSSKSGPNNDVVSDMIEKYGPPDKFSEIKKSLKSVILGKFKIKPDLKSAPRLKKTHLSLREKRRLGLYKLSRKGLKYQDFLELNNLWKQYMLDSLDFHSFKHEKGEVDVLNKHWEQLSTQLYKADYHGAQLTIVRARCPSLVGLRGIVVMETKNTFRIIGEDDTVKTIPKETCVFQMHINAFKLTVYGRHLSIKPAERSTKKIRSNLWMDL